MRVVDDSAVSGRKVRRLNAMKRKHLLGDGFVLRQHVGMRPCAGVRNIQHVKKCRDLHLLGVIARRTIP